ncbi:PLDc_N domain-containing protein [Streptosporangiaceae bacterium NEAU-GS5]|nr:PLDc_N domain-containing protein [Streptosporangiaceae bacterium NEAU-GS5]
MPSVILGLALLAFWLYCLFDVITTPEESVRNLPKILWLIIVIVLPDIGGIAWFLLGRPRTMTIDQVGDQIVHPSQLGRPSPGGAPRGPDDDPEFLRSLNRRIRGDD